MKRILILIVLLAATVLLIGCSSYESTMAPAGDAPENPEESGGKYTPEEFGGQSGATTDGSVDQLEAVAE